MTNVTPNLPNIDYQGFEDKRARALIALAHVHRQTATLVIDELAATYIALAGSIESVLKAERDEGTFIPDRCQARLTLDVEAFTDDEMADAGRLAVNDGPAEKFLVNFGRMAIIYGHLNTVEAIFGSLEESAQKGLDVVREMNETGEDGYEPLVPHVHVYVFGLGADDESKTDD